MKISFFLIENFSNIACYVGYYASDQFTIGDLVQCGQNSVCMKVNGTASGYSVEVSNPRKLSSKFQF